MTARCPHCSGDVSEDAPVRRGSWWLHPGGAFVDGGQLKLTRLQRLVIYAIARANGRSITHDDVPDVPGPAALTAHVRAIRKAAPAELPVEVSRAGFAWVHSS